METDAHQFHPQRTAVESGPKIKPPLSAGCSGGLRTSGEPEKDQRPRATAGLTDSEIGRVRAEVLLKNASTIPRTMIAAINLK